MGAAGPRGLADLEAVGPARAARLARAVAQLPPLRPYALDPLALAEAWRQAASLPAAAARLRFVLARGEAVAGAHAVAAGAFGRGAYLRLLAVRSEAAGQGLGGALLADFEGAWRPAGGWFLLTGATNPRAQAFYLGRGYREVGQLPGFVRPGIVECLMWRPPPGDG